MPILDSAHNGRPDPQDRLEKPIAECGCGCGEHIFFGNRGVMRYDGDYFVNANHLAKSVGAEEMEIKWL